jgi:hypothetical protein
VLCGYIEFDIFLNKGMIFFQWFYPSSKSISTLRKSFIGTRSQYPEIVVFGRWIGSGYTYHIPLFRVKNKYVFLV